MSAKSPLTPSAKAESAALADTVLDAGANTSLNSAANTVSNTVSDAGANSVVNAVPSARGRRRPRARAVHLVIGALVLALLAVELMLAAPSVFSAAGSLNRSSLSWLAVAAVAAATSMVAFARVRQRMLRAAGVQVPLTRSVAVSYAAGALNTTMPGGGVVSTAYTFRRIRGWGAPAAVATWCVAVTGLLATATLSVLGATGLILGGGSTGSFLRAAAEITAVLLLIAGIAALTSSPDRLAAPGGVALRWINRLRGRPAETGYAALSRLIDDLEVIRPSRRSWIDAWTLSLLNWVLDAACLAACCAAFGVQVSLPALLITYTAGMAATGLTPLPGGFGVVEAALLLGLTAAGAPWEAALTAVVVYRLLSVGTVALIGWCLIGARRVSRTATSGEQADPPAVASMVPLTREPAAVAAGPVQIAAGPVQIVMPPEPVERVEKVARRAPIEQRERVGKRPCARDVMTITLDSVAPHDSWQRVAKTMRRLQVSTMPVCDEHGDLCGIIDYRDIGLRCLAAGGSAATAASLAHDAAVTIGLDDPVDGVVRLMAQRRAWLVPVLDERRLIGVIHYADIVTGPAHRWIAGPSVGDGGAVGEAGEPEQFPRTAPAALSVAASAA